MYLLTAYPDLACETLHLSGAAQTKQSPFPWKGIVLDEKESSAEGRICELNTDFYGWNCILFEKNAASSQLDRLKTCNAPWPVLALALDGSGFHGQHQRPWMTGSGNLYLSAYFPQNTIFQNLSEAFYTSLHQIPCQAVWNALNKVLILRDNVELSIKYPNDIVTTIENQSYKLCGCLTELTVSGSKIESIRMGIGLNILHSPELVSSCGFPAICCAAIHAGLQDNLFDTILVEVARNLMRCIPSGNTTH